MHTAVLLARLSSLCFNIFVTENYHYTQSCTNVSNTSYLNTSVASRPECAEICSADGNCRSFSFHEAGQTSTCYLNQDILLDDGCSKGDFTHFNRGLQCLNDGVYNTATNTCTCVNGYVGEHCDHLMKDCSEGYNSGHYTGMEALFYIQPPTLSEPVRVRCEHRYGGRTVILRHDVTNPYVNFTRNWEDYKNGFGDMENDGNFYLGNEIIHQLTINGAQTLVFYAVTDEPEVDYYRQISHYDVMVGNESENYRLSHNSTWSEPGHKLYTCLIANNTEFSTFDRDNDADARNCALVRMSGWWFENCGRCNPLGEIPPLSVTEQFHRGDATTLFLGVPSNLAVRKLKLFLINE